MARRKPSGLCADGRARLAEKWMIPSNERAASEVLNLFMLYRKAILFRFNKAKYEELKQKGFRLEF